MDSTPMLQLAAPPVTLKLDLGAGQSPRDGFEGVDLWPKAQHVVDLLKFPWPWADNSVEELHCSHFIEHIPAREVSYGDMHHIVPADGQEFIGQDMLFAFFDEAWRILKPDGWLTVIAPALQSVRAFQDPTHRRFIPAETYFYLADEWRKLNKLDHYRVRCNFVCDVNPTIPQELSLLHPEAQARRVRESWNCTWDFVAKLKALK